ncbi:DUF1748-domain-containing protein [Rhizopus microsporus var. microsporus]|uniref:DUF1748-domain-containing protein n=2 Tax=Rhizopus microsporus TaxID=58291 RepID=A0A2G4SR48_RHIZD|nr:DUF1748-domain-containing protein [Rhizopus microsporus ATCC 52813]ORE06406.1 DUF1748-domain-containing protein [Rhizopus microsporus var. microsporus]PHZ11249.1 DUF1748-domain-containing protein [Rhizopus microsporus ATCC 52813]
MSKLIHYTFDALLISAFLAGIKRSTGLHAATDKIENKTIRSYVEKYLGFGEWVFDMTVLYLNHSSYFINRGSTTNDKRTSH